MFDGFDGSRHIGPDVTDRRTVVSRKTVSLLDVMMMMIDLPENPVLCPKRLFYGLNMGLMFFSL